MICPNCNQEVSDELSECTSCKFDLAMYKTALNRIYAEKLARMDAPKEKIEEKEIIYQQSQPNTEVHEVRCPYCNSSNLTRITSFDKAVNIAMFGLLGNKRKYQWHCNNCKTNW